MKQWPSDRYGSKRGFVNTIWHRLLYYLGHYSTFRHIEWHEVERLVFVCKGNICRSPFAEVVAKSIGLNAVSCGLHTREGLLADKNAMEAAAKRGQDLRKHKTNTIASLSLEKGDLFVVVEPWQGSLLKERLGENINITLLGLWCSPRYPHIPDPYGSNPLYFDRCFDLIEESVMEISGEIQKAKND